jgi:hypothetical protein
MNTVKELTDGSHFSNTVYDIFTHNTTHINHESIKKCLPIMEIFLCSRSNNDSRKESCLMSHFQGNNKLNRKIFLFDKPCHFYHKTLQGCSCSSSDIYWFILFLFDILDIRTSGSRILCIVVTSLLVRSSCTNVKYILIIDSLIDRLIDWSIML